MSLKQNITDFTDCVATVSSRLMPQTVEYDERIRHLLEFRIISKRDCVEYVLHLNSCLDSIAHSSSKLNYGYIDFLIRQASDSKKFRVRKLILTSLQAYIRISI